VHYKKEALNYYHEIQVLKMKCDITYLSIIYHHGVTGNKSCE